MHKTYKQVLGGSVMAPFQKTALTLWALPVTAILSCWVNVLPFDAYFGCVIPYHTFIGLNHIITGVFFIIFFFFFFVFYFYFMKNRNSNAKK